MVNAPEFHLSSAQKKEFEENGLLVIPSFFPKDTAERLLKRSKTILEEFSLDGHPLTVFSTGEEAADKHVGDDYFLNSGDKIRFFFEPDAFTDGKLNRPKELAVNKVGHALHELDPDFSEFTLRNQDIQNLAKELDFHEDPRVIQSMVICKQKEVGGRVNSHDDSTFLYTQPLSALGFWFALEDCTTSNGCLSFIPGSHKINSIDKRLVRVPGGGTEIVPIDGVPRNDVDWESPEHPWVTAECEAGALVLIHGSVIHRSEKNLSERSRFIYTFHMIEGSAKWDDQNWLQPTVDMPFTKLYGH